MGYEFFIANRYLKSKRKTGFISLITYMSMIGIMIGVAALIIVLSIMNGFESEVRSRIIGFGAHIELRTYHNEGVEDYKKIIEEIETFEHISGISPYIEDKALVYTAKKKKSGAAIKGIDPETIGQVSDIEDQIVYGIFEVGEIKINGAKSYPGIVLGRYLADKLNADLGDKVQLLSPSGISPLLSRMPALRTFKVTGLFETGIFEFDDVFAYVSMKEAQRLFEMGNKVSGLEIKLDDMNKAEDVATKIKEHLGYPYAAITWFEMNKNLFSWMQLEKWGMFIILSLIIIVAAFNIISTLIMIVLEKTKEIGVLKSMGASSSGIMKIFMFEGLIGGVVGTALGCIIGFVVCWAQERFQFFSLPPDVYIISALPILMKARDFIFIASAALLLCFMATFYPARKASKLDPVDAIRYE
ncbi:lipoprotein-releasing ABC transporter permease subunit [candidate division KSB1 bacterium]|nr:lipoprotein-releasing ABC transporter permease subunit [candidate division KSB1 bacterium]TDI84148.1 MAG: lipoprotein-releasing ABC transporter permease subunit [Caldithrix sp.]TDI92576.1 MAG: lipoprotein-releasing ABC transporter permease subunit [Caldithrix sp.]TDJ00401.1 MAG: lipoprotein-releasing ABC transporter permease subunit [Caldithrix sp.]